MLLFNRLYCFAGHVNTVVVEQCCCMASRGGVGRMHWVFSTSRARLTIQVVLEKVLLDPIFILK